jgi:hypothetical protein
MIESDSLHQTPFSKELVKDSTALAQESIKEYKGKQLPTSPRGEYIHQVLDSFSELNAILDNLLMAEIFLRSYYVSVRWRRKFDINHYFTYHYEMWIINAIRFYERLIILINSVYWLEISHKDTTFTTVSSHKKLQDTDTLKVLNKVHGALSELQGLKNSVFHRYIYDDNELREISTFTFVARHSKDEDASQFTRAAHFKMRYMYLPKKRKEISENNIQLVKAATAILETLHDQYVEHRVGLSNEISK